MQQNDSNKMDEFIATHIGKPVVEIEKKTFLSMLPSFKLRRVNYAAVGIIACVFIGVTNFESFDHVWGADDAARSGVRKSSLLVPAISPEDPGAAPESQPESFESYQLRILRNQNHLQAEKIKSLREELLEVNQKLHELKPHLFKQSDPADQAKIQELLQKLGETEQLSQRLSLSNESKEKELEAARKRLNEMETIKEALTAMVDQQRTSKEQNLALFKKQLEELHQSTEVEKAALVRRIQNHEQTHEHLQQQAAEKTQTIHRLDALASKLHGSLSTKDLELKDLEGQILSLYDEILLLTEIYTASNETLSSQVKEMASALDEGRMQIQQLEAYKEETQWISDLFHTTKEVLSVEISQLQEALEEEKLKNEELNALRSDLEAKKIELALILQTHGSHKKEREEYIQHLTAASELEKTRIKELENELLAMLDHQEQGHRYAEVLEGFLSEMDGLLTSKYSEIDASEIEHKKTVGTLLSHLDHSEQTSDHHQERASELKDRLAYLLNEQQAKADALRQSLKETADAYEAEKGRLSQFAELLEEISESEQALQFEVYAQNIYIKSKEQKFAEMEDLIEKLTSDLEVEKAQTKDYQDKIQLHLSMHQEQIDSYENELTEKHNQLQSSYEAHYQTESDYNNQIADLNYSLEKLIVEIDFERLKSYLLEQEKQQVSDLLSHFSSLLKQAEEKNQGLAEEIITMSDAIAEKEQMLDLAHHKADAVDFINQQEKQQLSDLVSHFSGVLKLAQEKNQSLAEQMIAMEDVIAEKEQLLDLAHHKSTTIDFDNQQLARQNQKLQEYLGELESLYHEAQQRTAQMTSQIELLDFEIGQSQNKLASMLELEHQLQEAIAEKESKEHQILSLHEVHSTHQQHWADKHEESLNQSNRLLSQLENEKEKNTALSKDLNHTRFNYNRERNNLLNLEKILQETTTKAVQLEEIIEEHLIALDQKDLQIQNLMDAKTHLKNNFMEMYAKKSRELEQELEEKKNLQEQLRLAFEKNHALQTEIDRTSAPFQEDQEINRPELVDDQDQWYHQASSEQN